MISPAGIAAGVAALAALYGLQHSTPHYADITSPVTIIGPVGGKVEGRTFSLGVLDIHAAREVRTENYGKQRSYSTQGVWLVVEAAAIAERETMVLTSAVWQGRSGLRYRLSDRFSNQAGYLLGATFDAGLPVPALMAFEVPEDDIAGGTLLVASSRLTPLGEQIGVRLAEKPEIREALKIRRAAGNVPWVLEAP